MLDHTAERSNRRARAWFFSWTDHGQASGTALIQPVLKQSLCDLEEWAAPAVWRAAAKGSTLLFSLHMPGALLGCAHG